MTMAAFLLLSGGPFLVVAGFILGLSMLAFFALGFLAARRWDQRRHFGSGSYHALPAVMPPQQVIRQHQTERFPSNEAPTRRMPSGTDPFTALEPTADERSTP